MDYRSITLEKTSLKIKALRNHIQKNILHNHINLTLTITTSILLNLTITTLIIKVATSINHSHVIPIIIKTLTRTHSHSFHLEHKATSQLQIKKKEETVKTVHLLEKVETTTLTTQEIQTTNNDLMRKADQSVQMMKGALTKSKEEEEVIEIVSVALKVKICIKRYCRVQARLSQDRLMNYQSQLKKRKRLRDQYKRGMEDLKQVLIRMDLMIYHK